MLRYSSRYRAEQKVGAAQSARRDYYRTRSRAMLKSRHTTVNLVKAAIEYAHDHGCTDFIDWVY